jgi:hypothetical protein
MVSAAWGAAGPIFVHCMMNTGDSFLCISGIVVGSRDQPTVRVIVCCPRLDANTAGPSVIYVFACEHSCARCCLLGGNEAFVNEVFSRPRREPGTATFQVAPANISAICRSLQCADMSRAPTVWLNESAFSRSASACDTAASSSVAGAWTGDDVPFRIHLRAWSAHAPGFDHPQPCPWLVSGGFG